MTIATLIAFVAFYEFLTRYAAFSIKSQKIAAQKLLNEKYLLIGSKKILYFVSINWSDVFNIMKEENQSFNSFLRMIYFSRLICLVIVLGLSISIVKR